MLPSANGPMWVHLKVRTLHSTLMTHPRLAWWSMATRIPNIFIHPRRNYGRIVSRQTRCRRKAAGWWIWALGTQFQRSQFMPQILVSIGFHGIRIISALTHLKKYNIWFHLNRQEKKVHSYHSNKNKWILDESDYARRSITSTFRSCTGND